MPLHVFLFSKKQRRIDSVLIMLICGNYAAIDKGWMDPLLFREMGFKSSIIFPHVESCYPIMESCHCSNSVVFLQKNY